MTRMEEDMEQEVCGAEIWDLPDSILLEIFVYFDAVDLCKTLGSVCRRWFLTSRDSKLWIRLEVTGARIDLRKLGKYLRGVKSSYPTAKHIVSMRITGFLSNPSPKNRSKLTLSLNLLKLLKDSCPNLRELRIIDADLKTNKPELDLKEFPPQLTFLGFDKCLLAFDLLYNLGDSTCVLPNLTALRLANCSNLSSLSKSIVGLLSRQTLRHLHLSHCHKIHKNHLCEIPANLTALETLHTANTGAVDDDFAYHVGKNLHTTLRTLDLAYCRQITDRAVEFVCHMQIQKLYLTETCISDACFKHLAKMTSLEYLSLVKTKCSAEEVNKLRQALPACQIEYLYSEATEPIGDTFWFVPLNEEQ